MIQIPEWVFDAHFGKIKVAPGYLLLQEIVKEFPRDWIARTGYFNAGFKNAVVPTDKASISCCYADDTWIAGINLPNRLEAMSVIFCSPMFHENRKLPEIQFLEKPISREQILEVVHHKDEILMLDEVIGISDNAILATRLLTEADLEGDNWFFRFMEMIGQLGCFFLLGGYFKKAKVGKMKGSRYPVFLNVQAWFENCDQFNLDPGSQVDIMVVEVGKERRVKGYVFYEYKVVFEVTFTYILFGEKRMKALIKKGRN